MCFNSEGSFTCGCQSGYTLADDKKTCKSKWNIDKKNFSNYSGRSIEEICLTEHYPCSSQNGGCDHTCVIVNDYTEKCICNRGYKLLSDGKSCAGMLYTLHCHYSHYFTNYKQ